MAKALAPRLVDHHGVRVCSVCTQSFGTVTGPSLNLAFRRHVEEAHSEKKQREAANQAQAPEPAEEGPAARNHSAEPKKTP
jgi:hypothetical protein